MCPSHGLICHPLQGKQIWLHNVYTILSSLVGLKHYHFRRLLIKYTYEFRRNDSINTYMEAVSQQKCISQNHNTLMDKNLVASASIVSNPK